MKKIIACLLLMILNAHIICVDQAEYISRIEQELKKTKFENATKIDDECAQHKATLLDSELGQKYAQAEKDWFGNYCGNKYNRGSQACKRATENMKKALVNLQKTDAYKDDYLPAISKKYKNKQKFEALLLMSGIVQQREHAIDSLEGRMLYAIDSMKPKLACDPEPLPMFLESSYDRGELNRQAQDELRHDLGLMESIAQ